MNPVDVHGTIALNIQFMPFNANTRNFYFYSLISPASSREKTIKVKLKSIKSLVMWNAKMKWNFNGFFFLLIDVSCKASEICLKGSTCLEGKVNQCPGLLHWEQNGEKAEKSYTPSTASKKETRDRERERDRARKKNV